VTHSENGKRERGQRSIIHAEGVLLLGVKRASSIIHAEGVRGWCSVIRAGGAQGLPIVGDPFELAAYVLKILRADAHAEHFLNHWEEIRQRTNRA